MREESPPPHYTHMRTLVLLVLALCTMAGAKTDAEIEADLKARLARSKIAANGFQAKVRNGVVTWTGTTSVIQHKGAATRMAKAAGAARVDNRIQIPASARAKAAQKMRHTNHLQPRTQPRTQAPGEQPREQSEAFVTPPVRRAVVRK